MIINKRINVSIIILAMITMLMMFSCIAHATVAETGRNKDQEISPGVWESTVYVTDSRNNNLRVHILRINKNSAVKLKVSTANHYSAQSTKNSRAKAAEKWGYATVEQMMTKYNAVSDREGTAIAGVNGDFYSKDQGGKTLGKLIMEGRVVNSSTKEPFFAVMKDGSYALKSGGSSTSNVAEAVGGSTWLVSNNKIKGRKGESNTLTSIGLTKNGDVIIACVDGREASSVGTTTYDLASIMKQQGCNNAILLDCGGSATFVTKRSSDNRATLRNVPNDGVVRPVSSALLIVKSKNSSSKSLGKPAISMVDKNSSLSKKDGYWNYKVFGKGISGFRMVNNYPFLFDSKGKGLTKNVTIGSTKYEFVKGELKKVSDKNAGRIAIGFCGATNGGQNLIYAYHYGNKQLNIGPNPLISNNSGKMKNWTNVVYVPWVSEIRHIKNVVVGKGVKNLGDYAFYVSRNPFNQAAKNAGSKLESVNLYSGLNAIGKYAIFNNNNLRSVKIPSSIKSVNTGGLAYNEKAVYTFDGDKPPAFAGKVFTTAGSKSRIKAPSSREWMKFLSNNTKRGNIGFNGAYEYSNRYLVKDKDGKWKVFRDGKVDTWYNDLAKNKYGWHKVTKGVFDPKYYGVARNQYGWFYVKKGKVDLSFTGLVKRPENGYWYYVNKGKIDWNYNGLAKNKNGWHKVTKGQFDPKYHGVAKNQYGWFYVKKGKVNLSYTGLVKRPENGNWYYVKNGQINWKANDLAKNKNGWHKVTKGQFDPKYNGLARNKYGWFYVKKGKVNLKFTGVIRRPEDGIYYYVKKGKLDRSFTGKAKDASGRVYKVKKGVATR